MRSCPVCHQTYNDDSIRFCLNDGTALVTAGPTAPPSYNVPSTMTPPTPQPWAQPPRRRVWPWVVGGLVVVTFLGIGLIVLIIAIAAMSSGNSNTSNQKSSNSNRIVISENNSNSSDDNSNSDSNPDTSSIASAHMAQDGNGEAGEEAIIFKSSDRTIHCVIRLTKPVTGTDIKFRWVGVDAGSWKDYTIKEIAYTTKENESVVNAHLTYSLDWPTGSYKVDVYVNGRF